MTTENDGANAPPDVRAETPEGGGPEVSPFTLERARHDRRIAERDRNVYEDSARYWREMYERVRNNAEAAMQRDHALMTERMELATKLSQIEKERDELLNEAWAERPRAKTTAEAPPSAPAQTPAPVGGQESPFAELIADCRLLPHVMCPDKPPQWYALADEALAEVVDVAQSEGRRMCQALMKERDEARAEVEKLRSVLASRHGGEPETLLRELDEARAERDEARTAERAATEAWKRLLGDEAAARAEVERLKGLVSEHEPEEHSVGGIRARGGGKNEIAGKLRAEVELLKKEIERLNIDHLSAESRWDDDSLGLSQEIERLKNQLQTECDEGRRFTRIAVEDEREACAKMLETQDAGLYAWAIAAIRARGGK